MEYEFDPNSFMRMEINPDNMNYMHDLNRLYQHGISISTLMELEEHELVSILYRDEEVYCITKDIQRYINNSSELHKEK